MTTHDLGTSWMSGDNKRKKPRQEDPKAVSFAEKDRNHYNLLALYGPQEPPTDRKRGRKHA